MRQFMYVVIVIAMLGTWLSSPEMHVLPGPCKYLPDLLSMLVIVYVFTAGVRQNFRDVAIKYWLAFGTIALIVICGPIVNNEEVGPIIAGIRFYLRPIPFFFLPAVVAFSEADVQKYLKVILALSVLQCPVNIYQRITGLARGEFTGDIVVGTLDGSSYVTIFIICVLCVMTALTVRGRMSKMWFGACFLPLIVAVSINETKVVVFLLPVTLLLTFLVAMPKGRRLRGAFQGIAALTVASIIFVPLYNSLSKKDDGTHFYNIQDFVTNPETLHDYLFFKKNDKEAGRGDALVAPIQALSSDPIKAAFGLGIGNVSMSGMGTQYSGHYVEQYFMFALLLSLSVFLFEIGILGTALLMGLLIMILMDALYVTKHDRGFMGDLAVGFIGVWLTIFIGLFYATIHANEAISLLFWFFAGLFAAHRQRLVGSRIRAKSSVYYTPAISPLNLKAR